MSNSRSNLFWISAMFVMGTALLGLVASVPELKGKTDWTGQLIKDGWMAWSFPVAMFFWLIVSTLLVFSFLAMRFPEKPRLGILGIFTTRGDRLFITLLGSAFINISWLGLSGQPQWQALLLCLGWALAVFRLV